MNSQDVLHQAEKIFTDFLARQGLKFTDQRRHILDAACKMPGHFSAEKLLEHSRSRDKTISKATVYRTLPLLKDSHLLEEHDFGNGRKSYERAYERRHHDHLICIKCGRIIEFENNMIERYQNEEADKLGFKLIYHSHKLFGFCKKCASGTF